MTPSAVDHKRSKTNPWGLTPYQCMTIRLVCEHGGTKRSSHIEDLPLRTLEHHLLMSRKAMKMYGNDVRLYLEFDRWVRQQSRHDQTWHPSPCRKEKPPAATQAI